MNHIKQIAGKLDEYGLDAMLVTSQPGERYAVDFHGEGLALITKTDCWYFTDSASAVAGDTGHWRHR